MINYVWALILISSIFFSFINGNLDVLEKAITESSSLAVEFVLSFCGIMAMWSGLMEIAHGSGLIKKASKVLLPFTKLLFPHQKDPETLSTIIMSFMANIFGAGNSSTVFALKAMEKLDEQNGRNQKASNDMCMFAVVNMAFAPIFPIMTIEIRSLTGSHDPYSTTLPSLITSLITIIISIIVCKYYERKSP